MKTTLTQTFLESIVSRSELYLNMKRRADEGVDKIQLLSNIIVELDEAIKKLCAETAKLNEIVSNHEQIMIDAFEGFDLQVYGDEGPEDDKSKLN